MKGIILAGGAGTRLDPATRVINKQLLPIYDKPMIFYVLSTLMLGGIRDVLIITSPGARPLYEELLGDGNSLGMRLCYATQDKPNGVPEGLTIGREFLDGGPCTFILGDNIFVGHMLGDMLEKSQQDNSGAKIFLCRVSDPERYGVADFDNDGTLKAVVEKPENPSSNWAITGLYVLDAEAPDIASGLIPSARGELEMVDLLRDYLRRDALKPEKLGRGYAWLDSGTHESLLDAAQYIATIEQRQGLKIGCLEEIALRKGFIDIEAFRTLADSYPESSYGRYLRVLLEEHYLDV